MKRWMTVLTAMGGAAAALTAIAVVMSVSNGDGDERGTASSAAPSSLAPPSRDEPTDPTPIALDTAPPATRPRLSDLGRPSTNPAACAHLRERAAALVKELGPKITAEDRAGLAAAMQDVLSRGQRQADGYIAFAGGELLTGNLTAAAWAGLEALVMEWRPDFVANTGVYLYHLERLDDADAFLACARELDPRSPFVIEAQALVAMKRKQCDRAKELIELAVRLLPGDMNVRYSAGVIHHTCGDRAKAAYYLREALRTKPDDETVLAALEVVDPDATKRRPRNALDRLVDECHAFLDETLARGELASEYNNLISRALLADQWEESHNDFEQLRDNVQLYKQRIKDEFERARETRFAPPDPVAWNATVYECAAAYAQIVQDYERVVGGMGGILIMASAYGMDPVVYAGKLRHSPTNVWFLILEEEKKYLEAVKPAMDRLSKCTEASENDDPCYREFCGTAVPLWQAYRDAVKGNCQIAEAGFPSAAEDYGNFWLAQVRRAAEFGNRATKILKPTPLVPKSHKETAQAIANIVQISIGGTIELVSLKVSGTYEELTRELETAPQYVLSFAAGPPGGDFRLCPQDGSPPVGMDERIDPFLEALKASTKFEYGWGLDCDAKVGGVGVSLSAKSWTDVTVKVSKKFGKVSVAGSLGSNGRVGGDVSYSQSAGGGAPGVVAKATVKVWAKGRSDGTLDYGAQLDGKIGGGVNIKGVELACYPFSGKVTFNARAFAAAL